MSPDSHLAPAESVQAEASATYGGDHPGGTLALTEHRLLYVADGEALVDVDRGAVSDAAYAKPTMSAEFALPGFLALVLSVVLWLPYPQWALLAFLAGPTLLVVGFVLRRRALRFEVDGETYGFSSRDESLLAIANGVGAQVPAER